MRRKRGSKEPVSEIGPKPGMGQEQGVPRGHRGYLAQDRTEDGEADCVREGGLVEWSPPGGTECAPQFLGTRSPMRLGRHRLWPDRLAEQGSIGWAPRERPASRFHFPHQGDEFFFQMMNPKLSQCPRTVMKPSTVRPRALWLWKKRRQPGRAPKQTWRSKVTVGP